MSMKWSSLNAVLLSVLLLLAPSPAWAQAPKARVQGGDCSDLVVNRSFSQGFEGLANLGELYPGAPLVPNAGAGFLTFLPKGKWKDTMTITTGMLAIFETVQIDGVYDISFDTTKDPVVCTGTMTGTADYGPPLGSLQVHFQLVVSDEGQRIEMIHTDPVLIVSLSGFPVRAFGCSNQTIAGTYSENIKGWGLAGLTPPLSFPPEQLLGGYFPFAASGAVEFRPRVPPSSTDFPDSPPGSGSVVFWDTGSENGTTFQRTGKGWYTVDQDCTGMVVLRDSLGHPDFHLKTFVGKNGKAVDSVNIDPAPGPVPGSTIPAFVLGTTLDRIDKNAD